MGADTYDRILSALNDMDAEHMPNERRAHILAIMVSKPDAQDMAWAESLAPLPPVRDNGNGGGA